jgi:soluble lytic murein transglycosylase-like protein
MFALAFQLPCQEVGPPVALASAAMKNTFIKPLLLSLLLVTAVAGQTRRDSSSLQERAQALEPFIIESAKRYGIDVRILRAMCFVESRFRVDAVSPKGARGPMQFMPETAVRYGLRNPHDPKTAIDAAARYLRDLLTKFDGRVDLAVAAYNAGEGAVESFRTGRPLPLRSGKIINPHQLVTGGVPPYRETQNYVKQILMPLTSGLVARPSVTSTARKTEVAKRKVSTLDVNAPVSSEESKQNRAANSSFIEIKDDL